MLYVATKDLSLVRYGWANANRVALTRYVNFQYVVYGVLPI